MPPVKPMLAKPVSILPRDMLYEPKFDGFRCIVFRDGDEVELGSRKELPMARYFPELVPPASSCCRGRPRPPSSPSTCWPSATRATWSGRSPSAGPRSRSCSAT